MAKLHFGLVIPNGPRGNIDAASFLQATRKNLDTIVDHFDSLWFTDHLQFQDNPVLEGWTALTYMAALYPSLQFGHVVLAQSFRNPGLLAKMSSTAQFMSGGKFILGIGAGWHQEEYDAYGYPFPSPGQRVQELEETLQIVKALWTEQRASFQGKYYRVTNAVCEPRPESHPLIMIGGSQPRMLRLIARHADWWNVSQASLEHYRELVKESEKACREVGRDPASLQRSWFGGCLCVPEGTDLESIDRSQIRTPNPLIGTPEQIIEQLRAFIKLGVTSFLLKNEGFPDTTTLQLLIEKVIPALQS